MIICRLYIFFFLFFGYCISVHSQYFRFQGDAVQLDEYNFALTQDLPHQAGLMQYKFPVDITQDFTINFQLNFGNHDQSGGEGFAFVLSNKCLETLQSGGNLGIENLANSLVVDFDTNFSGLNNNDSYEDHNGIYNNGSFSNGSNIMDGTNSPVCLLPACANVENNEWYDVSIHWTYLADNLQKLEVFFNGSLISSSTANHRNQRFNNNQYVFWFISASTGDVTNLQKVKYNDPNQVDTTLDFCMGESFTLTAPILGSGYTWTNNNSTTNTATYVATSSTEITCNYYDYCGRPDSITYTINVEQPNFSISNNGPICINEDAIFNFQGNPNNTVQFTINNTAQSIQLDSNGVGVFTVANCTISQTISNVKVTSPSGCEFVLDDISVVEIKPSPTTSSIIPL